jgi:PAS domain S-box
MMTEYRGELLLATTSSLVAATLDIPGVSVTMVTEPSEVREVDVHCLLFSDEQCDTSVVLDETPMIVVGDSGAAVHAITGPADGWLSRKQIRERPSTALERVIATITAHPAVDPPENTLEQEITSPEDQTGDTVDRSPRTGDEEGLNANTTQRAELADIPRRETTGMYATVVEGMEDAVTIHNPETGKISFANEAYLSLSAYDTREQLEAANLTGVHSHGMGYVARQGTAVIQRVHQTGEPERIEWQVKMDDCRQWIETVMSPEKINSRDRVVAVHRDITEQKRRQREYEQIFNNVNDSIIIHDPETKTIVDVNDTFCELVGYDRERH